MTSTVEALCRNYEDQVRIWGDANLAGPQKVWFAVYPPNLERRLRLRLSLFADATRKADRNWKSLDLTTSFARWMAAHNSREAYFEHPERLALGIKRFESDVAKEIRQTLEAPDVSDRSVVALTGVGSLFGLASASQLVADVAPAIRGRLLLFFPGHTEGNLFKLLDATAGYNYMAVAITAESGG